MRHFFACILLLLAPAIAAGQATVTNHDVRLITRADGTIPVGDGSKFVGESGATARTSLGLGASDSVQLGQLGIGLAPVSGRGALQINGGAPSSAQDQLGFYESAGTGVIEVGSSLWVNLDDDATSSGDAFSIRANSSSAKLFEVDDTGDAAIGGGALSGYPLSIFQSTDDGGLRCYGYDDKASSYLSFHVGQYGESYATASGDMYWRASLGNYVKFGATTVELQSDNQQLTLGAGAATDSYLTYTGTEGEYKAAGGLRLKGTTLTIESGLATLTAGANVNSGALTDNAVKACRFVHPQYDTDEEGVMSFYVYADASTNRVMFGGGSASYNAATQLNFKTAANNSTVTGTDRIIVDATGTVSLPNDSQKLALGAGEEADSYLTFTGSSLAAWSANNIGLQTTSPLFNVEIENSTSTSLGADVALGVTNPGAANDLAEIGFGYRSTAYLPVVIGAQTTDAGGSTKGDFFVATRSTTTNVAPTKRMVVESGGLCQFQQEFGGIEKSSDPAEPAEGEYVIWMADGSTSKGDDGDVCIASKAGGTTKWAILFDHSAGSAW